MHAEMIDNGEEELKLLADNTLRGLSKTLNANLVRAVKHKEDVEARMLHDERQYWGDRYEPQNRDGDDSIRPERPLGNNVTRQKCVIAASRIGDMLFPTNDCNYQFTLGDTSEDLLGNPVDPAQAEQALKFFDSQIDDDLRYCNYAREGRAAIFDGVKLGTGILKGPVMKTRTKRRMTREPVIDSMTGQPAMTIGDDGMPRPVTSLRMKSVQETRPGVCRVDPFMFFPMPARSMEECEGTFELHLYSKAGLRDISEYPGFDRDAITEVMRKGANASDSSVTKILRQRHETWNSSGSTLKDLFAVWECHCSVSRADLECIGAIGEVEFADLDVMYCEVWLCGDTILKVEPEFLVEDHRMPYYVYCYEKDENDIFGFGLPYIMRDEQDSIDEVHDAILHNTAVSAGPQIGIKKGIVTPADGKFTIRGPKLWYLDQQDGNISNAIQAAVIPNTAQHTLPVYERLLQQADENTNLPMLLQGEATNAVPTSSGMAMLANASNIVQRRAAHNWDDDITIPMLTRFINFRMAMEDREELMIAIDVIPRGASYLLVKDMQAQHAYVLLQMAGQDPAFRAELDMTAVYKTYVGFLDVPQDQLFLTDEQKAQQGADPAQQLQIQQAQAQLEKLSAETQKIMAEAQKAMADAQPKAPDGAMGLEAEKLAVEMEGIRSRIVVAQLGLQEKALELLAKHDIEYAKMTQSEAFQRANQVAQQTLDEMRIQMEGRKLASTETIAGARLKVDAMRETSRQQNIARGYDSL